MLCWTVKITTIDKTRTNVNQYFFSSNVYKMILQNKYDSLVNLLHPHNRYFENMVYSLRKHSPTLPCKHTNTITINFDITAFILSFFHSSSNSTLLQLDMLSVVSSFHNNLTDSPFPCSALLFRFLNEAQNWKAIFYFYCIFQGYLAFSMEEYL